MKHVLIMALLILASADLFADNTISMTVGDVKLQAQGSSAWQNVKTGQKIKVGDTIQTGLKSFAEIDASANTIRIQPKTKVKFTMDMIDEKPQSSLSLFTGSVNCKMDKLKKGKDGYNVNTPSSVCSVRGTEFDVAAGADGRTVLQVTDGTVEFGGMSKSVMVAQNQESGVNMGGEPEPVKIIKRQDWEKWANESSSDVKGKESDIIAGCLAKMQKLDSDIMQLEKQSIDAIAKYNDLSKQTETEKNAGNKDKANEIAKNAEINRMASASFNNMAFYQASRIDLVKDVADNAYNSSDKKSSLNKSYDLIQQIYDKYFIKYIKPILDSAKERQQIMDSKKKK
jgi:hypothetical protein